MRMSRLVLRRMALLSLLVFALGAALVAWQSQGDVQREVGSAHAIARVLDMVWDLPLQDPARRTETLHAIDAVVEAGQLRHLRIRILDQAGHDLLAPAPAQQASLLQSWLFSTLTRVRPEQQHAPVSWVLPLTDGGRYLVTLTVDPSSEQREAMEGIVDLLSVLALSGVLMLAAAWWSLRQALSPLQGILAAIDGYGHHDFSRRAPAGTTHEMNAISGALNHLARSLEEAQQARTALSMKLLTLQEDERAHLARELHDEFGQMLTAMRADAAWLAQRLHGQPELHAVAEELRSHCDRASGDIRDLLQRLRPVDADADAAGGVPLQRMLAALVDGWNARPGVAQRFALEGRIDAPLPEALALALYRISQEALTNAARHSRADTVTLALGIDPAGLLHWRAEDDGVGLRADHGGEHADGSPAGNGLDGIRERVWAHGGELDIAPRAPGDARPGLRLHARFPRSACAFGPRGQARDDARPGPDAD